MGNALRQGQNGPRKVLEMIVSFRGTARRDRQALSLFRFYHKTDISITIKTDAARVMQPVASRNRYSRPDRGIILFLRAPNPHGALSTNAVTSADTPSPRRPVHFHSASRYVDGSFRGARKPLLNRAKFGRTAALGGPGRLWKLEKRWRQAPFWAARA